MDRRWIFLFFLLFISIPVFVKAQIFNNSLISSIPGRVEGRGKAFEIKNSAYLNVTLESEKEIEVVFESIPRMISLTLNASNETTTILTIKGLEPNKKYFKYEDSHKNETEVLTDEKGNYSFTQDLTKPHHIWIQEKKGTIFLPEKENKYGIWNESTRTYTLAQDLTESVEIIESNFTFDGNGHSIVGDGSGYGIYISWEKANNVVIKNTKIKNFTHGILVWFAAKIKITENSISEVNGNAIYLISSSEVILNNEISSNKENGIGIYYNARGGETISGLIANNEILNNNYGMLLLNQQGTIIEKNRIKSNSIGLLLSSGEDYDFSFQNEIRENLFEDNYWGLWLTKQTKENFIYHNNFINNTIQAFEEGADQRNFFNKEYPIGGNYWSDYQGKDENGDGIGDEPYCFGLRFDSYIVAYACDNYSFMKKSGWKILPKVLISEVYYDVAQGKGEDPYNEWVIIHNLEGEDIDLSGWEICDNESCDSLPNLVLPSGNFAIISASSTTFELWRIPKWMIKILLTTKTIGNGLANKGDRVILKDKEGRIVDAMSYGEDASIFDPPCTAVADGKSLLRYPPDKDTDTAQDFIESDPTIGKNWPPTPIINFSPKNPVKGVKVKFNASSSTDPDGEIVKFEWQIASTTLSGTTTEFVFNENGEYEITLIVTDNDGTTSSTSTTIKVEPFSFAIITDLHIGRGYPDYDGEGFDDGYGGEEYYLTERLRNVVKWIIQNKDNIQCENATCSIKFLVILGDIADSGEKSEFLKAKEILDELNNHGIPYVPVLGNHDVWPKTDLGKKAEFPLGANYFEEIFFNENATNTKLLKEELNLDKKGFQYKNFIFKFGGINFIVLDFITRKDIGKATLREETVNWLRETLNALQGKEPIILFSHHPLTEESSRELYGFKIVPFPGTNFGKETIQFLFKILEEYEAISEGKQILAAFGGHVHGYYPQEIFAFKIPELNWFFEANWQYPSLGTISVLTTEALMVGSNREDEYLKEANKGVIRIVKILDNQTIDFDEIEGRCDPNTEKGKEFIALNPYISRAYTAPLPNTSSCLFFKAHAFTKREISFLWDFGDNTTSSHAWIPLKCYDKEGVYEVKLILKDKNTGKEEFITRTVEVKNEGFISKTLKLAESTLEKVKMISKEFSEDLKEIMRKVGNIALDFRDQILFQVETTRSEKVFVPVANITVHFEKANGDIDLSNLKLDSDLKKKKSLFYSPTWPEEIEKEKILFIPK